MQLYAEYAAKFSGNICFPFVGNLICLFVGISLVAWMGRRLVFLIAVIEIIAFVM